MKDVAILPMTKGEIARLESAVTILKAKHRMDIQERMMNDAFAMAAVINYDNDIILIDLKYGVNISIPELCFRETVKIDRKSMKVVESNETTNTL